MIMVLGNITSKTGWSFMNKTLLISLFGTLSFVGFAVFVNPVLAAERYLCKPSVCAAGGCNRPCNTPVGAQWNGRDYTVTRGTYVIKNKCIGVDTTRRPGATDCACLPLGHITNPRGEGYDTCDLPDVERYFSNTVGTRLGWEYGFCGTQQTDINVRGQNYWHSLIDMGPEVCSVPVSPFPTESPTPSLTPSPTLTPTPLPVPVELRVEYYRSDTTCTGEPFGAAIVSDTMDRIGGPANAPPDSTSDNVALWLNKQSGTYTLSVNVPGYHVVGVCNERNGADVPDDGLTQVVNSGDTMVWKVGIRPPLSWVQTGGGDVYASSRVYSSLPEFTPSHAFNVPGAGGDPGVVIYGTDYQFSSDPALKGRENVSASRWLAQSRFNSFPLYSAFFALLRSPNQSTWSGGNPPSECTTCYASGPGPYTVSGTWDIGSSQKIIILVDGDLAIRSNINVANGGFLAFIVNGNIVVDDSIGTTVADSRDPQLEGVFIANKSFKTGSGSNKLIAEGMFIASDFELNRDFDSSDNNAQPSELFLYAPRFLVSMPDEMLETVLRWQEVNP